MTPVFFLTNPSDNSLPAIHEELEDIVQLLEKEECIEKINIQWRSNVSINSFSSAVRSYKHRIVLFHYAGHANSQELLFTDKAAKAEGIAKFFSKQPYIHLAVLNGCSTQEQVGRLLKVGVPAVIATVEKVPDRQAATFSKVFYQEWIQNRQTITEAFKQATNHLRLKQNNIQIQIHRGLGLDLNQDLAVESYWHLHFHPEYPWVSELRFEDIVNNPLIGVPPFRSVPSVDNLSGKLHFKGLSAFEADDARLFFGRDKDIKNLYSFVVTNESPSLLLLYGQSGVGKSSLLKAGLLSRLSSDQSVVLIRENFQQLEELQVHESEGTLILLDQLETILWESQELRALFIVNIQKHISKGARIIFSFRKEYLAEFTSWLEGKGLPYLKQFVEPLSPVQVEEIILKMHRLPVTTRDYYFEKPDALAAAISNQLRDPESSIAPLLQLLLSTMYREALPGVEDRKKLDVALLDRIGRRGQHLESFLAYELKQLGEQSGLALDLLLRLTDKDRMIATSHTYSELIDAYPEQQKELPELIKSLENRYLILIKTQRQLINQKKEEQKRVYLAHDTLAREVVIANNTSDRPAQRARRILNAKLREEGLLLDPKEIQVIETGLPNTSRMNEPEKNLLNISKLAHRSERRKRYIQFGILLGILLAAFTAWQLMVIQPKAVTAGLTNIDGFIKDGNWEQVKETYFQLGTGKKARQHYLKTLLDAPLHTNASQIKALGSVVNGFPNRKAETRQSRAVLALWLSLSPYWRDGLSYSLDPEIKDSVSLRNWANENLGMRERSQIERFFPTFSKVTVEGAPFDSCTNKVLTNFEISKHEVRVKEFLSYLNLTEISSLEQIEKIRFPQMLFWSDSLRFWYSEEKKYDLPVQVTFQNASNYCRWAGYQLPSERQWDWLIQSQLPPSGEVIPEWETILQPDLIPVDQSRPNGFGLKGMMANVSEWVTDCCNCQEGYGYRGGNKGFSSYQQLINSMTTTSSGYDHSRPGIGLRPVK